MFARYILVSPQRRILVGGWQVQLLFGEDEVLDPAKSLFNGDTVTAQPCDIVRYVHLFFDRYQPVTTSGLVFESFFPGQEVLSGLDQEAARELFALLPELRTQPQGYGPTNRPVRCDRQAAVLRAT